jgi:acyl carrier protein
MSDTPAAPAASVESRILTLLVGVAPDIDPQSVRPELDFRDQFDFDSMDLFNFAAALHQSFGIDIPERDYRQLAGLAKCAAYLRQKVPADLLSGAARSA